MKLLSKILMLLMPLIICCQNLPIIELERIGLSQEEIEKTLSMNGKNGYKGNYLIHRKVTLNQNRDFKLLGHYYELLTPQGTLVPLTDPRWNPSSLIYFEFLTDEVLIIEKTIIGVRWGISISKFHIQTGEMSLHVKGDVPCEYGNDCEWIIYKEKKLAFFTNFQRNPGLELLTIYEYDWRSDQIELVYGKLPYAIDAVTGRNSELRNVIFNKNRRAFEYNQ